MASSDVLMNGVLAVDVYEKIINLVWGENVTEEEVFLRWTQGFQFTEGEPSALIQISGGPCAVIAPVQAYIMKNVFFTRHNSTENVSNGDLNSISDAEAKKLLGNSVYDILRNVSQDGNVQLVTHLNSSTDSAANSSANCDGQSSHKRPKLFSFRSFHKELVCKNLQLDKLKDSIGWYVDIIMGDFGVLSLLYSAILTYGLDNLEVAVEDPREPLIHPTHGHGGQFLVNLLLTGEGTPNVFDGEEVAGGMKLKGISKQSQIGFLTLIEAHQYLEVGWNLKSPVYPIWVLGSETHLTVLFSQDKRPLDEDKQAERQKVIDGYDTERNGFLDSKYLRDLMAALNLISEPEEYVDIMKEKLDSEGLGIILVRTFMEEFFPKDVHSVEEPRTFALCHYNGIKRSNNSNKVEYHYADAKLRDFLEPTVSTDSSHILKCLQTKWPTIELEWKSPVAPSLN